MHLLKGQFIFRHRHLKTVSELSWGLILHANTIAPSPQSLATLPVVPTNWPVNWVSWLRSPMLINLIEWVKELREILTYSGVQMKSCIRWGMGKELLCLLWVTFQWLSNSYLVGFYRHFLSVSNASSVYVATARPACMVLLNLFCIFSVDQISFWNGCLIIYYLPR